MPLKRRAWPGPLLTYRGEWKVQNLRQVTFRGKTYFPGELGLPLPLSKEIQPKETSGTGDVVLEEARVQVLFGYHSLVKKSQIQSLGL